MAEKFPAGSRGVALSENEMLIFTPNQTAIIQNGMIGGFGGNRYRKPGLLQLEQHRRGGGGGGSRQRRPLSCLAFGKLYDRPGYHRRWWLHRILLQRVDTARVL